MARLPYPDPTDPDITTMIEEVRTSRNGKLPRLFLMHMHNPAILHAWLSLGTALRYETQLDDRSRELSICMVSQLIGYDYQFEAHAPIAVKAGVPTNALDRLPDWKDSEGLTFRDQLVLRYTEELTGRADIDDELFSAICAEFDPPQAMELTAMIAFYGCGGRFLKALGIDASDVPHIP